MAPTPIEVEAYDSDHETSDQVTAKPRRTTRTGTASKWYGNPILEVMLLDNNEPTSYGEVMVGVSVKTGGSRVGGPELCV